MFRRAFTLIELLVVVTIIVVLLTLLTPAMDQAIYQAELAVCGTNLYGTARGVQTYAVDFRRQYPYRAQVHRGSYKPNNLYIGSEFHTPTDPDDRRVIRGYLSINGHLNDPLVGEIDMENAKRQSQVESPYNLWFGWQFRYQGTGQGMFKLGDRFTYQGERFDVLASDMDTNDDGGNPDADSGGMVPVMASHADKEGEMVELVQQDTSSATGGSTPGGVAQYVLARWQGPAFSRGTLDMNYVHTDGSVSRLTKVPDHVGTRDQDERVTGVVVFNDGAYFPTAKNYLPPAH